MLFPKPFHLHAQLILSICIVILNLLMILCHSTIIYQMNFKNKKDIRGKSKDNPRVPILCVVIAIVFVIFTLPYATLRLSLEHVLFWDNYILVWNSGMNSIVYFFRNKIKRYQRKKTPKQINPTKEICDIKNTQQL